MKCTTILYAVSMFAISVLLLMFYTRAQIYFGSRQFDLPGLGFRDFDLVRSPENSLSPVPVCIKGL